MSFTNVVAMLVACQSAQFTVPAQQQQMTPTIRVFNATQPGADVRLDLWLDGAKVADSLSTDTMTGPFTPVGPTTARLVVKKPGGPIGILDLPVNLSGKDHVVVLLGKPDAGLHFVDVAVAGTTAPDDRPQISLVNAIPDIDSNGPVDVYLMGMDDKLGSAQPKSKAVAFEWSAAVAVPPASYFVVVTKAGTKDVIAQSHMFYADKGQRMVAILLGENVVQTDTVAVVNLSHRP